MYWESGSFDAAGNLVVSTPITYLTTSFRRWRDAGRLIPLTTLVSLTRDQFYSSEPTLVYSQAGMLLFYLMQNHQVIMNDLFAALNTRTVTTNDQLIVFLTARTGLTLAQLDAAYIAYAGRFVN